MFSSSVHEAVWFWYFATKHYAKEILSHPPNQTMCEYCCIDETLENEYLFANSGVDTAENESRKGSEKELI